MARALRAPGALIMWKRLTRKRLEAAGARNAPVTGADIAQARSVLFAVFARYGDSVITFKLLREFARTYPDKKYLLITSPQVLPYAEAILSAVDSLCRPRQAPRPFRPVAPSCRLQREPFDVGFNPWSHGQESEYFISFAKRFHAPTARSPITLGRTTYMIVRAPISGCPKNCRHLPEKSPVQAKRILISPFSTDVRKSLNQDDLKNSLSPGSASATRTRVWRWRCFPEEDAKVGDLPLARFLFRQEPETFARVSGAGEGERFIRGCGRRAAASGRRPRHSFDRHLRAYRARDNPGSRQRHRAAAPERDAGLVLRYP